MFFPLQSCPLPKQLRLQTSRVSYSVRKVSYNTLGIVLELMYSPQHQICINACEGGHDVIPRVSSSLSCWHIWHYHDCIVFISLLLVRVYYDNLSHLLKVVSYTSSATFCSSIGADQHVEILRYPIVKS